MEKLSSEQRTQLMVKKMTLELDLNAKQQEQVKQIIAEQMVKREAMRAEQMAKKEEDKKPVHVILYHLLVFDFQRALRHNNPQGTHSADAIIHTRSEHFLIRRFPLHHRLILKQQAIL